MNQSHNRNESNGKRTLSWNVAKSEMKIPSYSGSALSCFEHSLFADSMKWRSTCSCGTGVLIALLSQAQEIRRSNDFVLWETPGNIISPSTYHGTPFLWFNVPRLWKVTTCLLPSSDLNLPCLDSKKAFMMFASSPGLLTCWKDR